MNKDFAGLFAAWLDDPDNIEVNNLLHDILVDGGLEKAAEKFTKKQYTVYDVIIEYPLTLNTLIGNITERHFSSLAEAKAYMFAAGQFFYDPDGEAVFYINTDKEKLIEEASVHLIEEELEEEGNEYYDED